MGASLGALILGSCGSGPHYYNLKGDVDNANGSLSYEIFVRSFYDSNGDGVGDFKGVAEKAQYLQDLGVSNVWLMPIYPTSSYHGYDVTDFYGVNSEFGTMDDFTDMVAELKKHGIRVTLDMVLNHSGSRHPWFAQSYRDYLAGNKEESSKADWYNWSESDSTGYAKFGEAYYEARFSSSMPDFNWDSLAFRKEVKNILNFWMEKGIYGFRLDAVLYYYYNQHEKNAEVCTFLKEACPEAYFVGEAWCTGSSYYRYFDSKLDSFFDFDTSISANNDFITTAKGFTSGDSLSKKLEEEITAAKSRNPDAYPSFFLSNHDQDRSSKSLNGNSAKLAASLLYLTPGTPYIYYGEEIGLEGTRGKENSDAMRRLPMIWSKSDKKGETKCPDPSVATLYANLNQVEEGADDLYKDPTSLLSHYRKLGEVRNSIPWIQNASLEAISTNSDYICAFTLISQDKSKKMLVVTNTAREGNIDFDVPSSAKLFDSINTIGVSPSLNGGKLTLASSSTAILTID